MKKEKRLVPELRFPEFNNDWVSIKLGEISKFSRGKGISKNDIEDDGVNKCIRYGELYTTYNEVIDLVVSRTNVPISESVLSEKNDVIIPSSGETQLDIATASCVLHDDIILGSDLNIIKSKINGVFLAYLLNNSMKKDIAKLAQGNSIVHLYNKQLASLWINIPIDTEQQKIANFLTVIDNRLQSLEKKKSLLEEYKKGVMQQIFNQEIRFRDEDGQEFPKWEKKKLEDICSFYSGGTPKSTNKSFYSGDIPFIGSGNISELRVDNFITTEALNSSSAKLVEKGDLLYALYGATSGEVAISKIDGAINQAVLCIKTSANKYYLFQLLKYKKNRIVKTYIQGGQGNLSAKIIRELIFTFPSLSEQTKIANFLSAIDDKINLVTNQIEKTEEYKNGLLQKMFV